MRVSLGLSFLLAFLDPGTCLQCEICHSMGKSCSGPMKTCTGGEDTCGIILHEVLIDDPEIRIVWDRKSSLFFYFEKQFSTGRVWFLVVEGGTKISLWEETPAFNSGEGGMAISSSIKSCLPSHVCHLGPVTVNYGKVKAKSHLVCCTGDDCRTTSVSLPPDNDVPNGYQCPACYSVDSFQCGDEVVNCTGSEDQCVDLAGLMNAGGLSLKAAMKGCTTISECNMVGDGKNSLGMMDIKLKRFQCRPASAMYSVVYSAGVASPHTTFLPVLSGFLLEKVLF